MPLIDVQGLANSCRGVWEGRNSEVTRSLEVTVLSFAGHRSERIPKRESWKENGKRTVRERNPVRIDEKDEDR